MKPSRDEFHAAPDAQPLLRQIGLDAEACFTHPDIRIWRSIPERENATLDAALADGRTVRLHLKRYAAHRGSISPARAEINGLNLLVNAGIPTVSLAAWGELADGRSVVVLQDLAGYAPAEKLLEQGIPFDRLRDPLADLTADLHAAGLHHRDLYLNHFFIKLDDEAIDIRLIDPGRVRPLPRWPFRQRWIVKDLAQFWYSTLARPVRDAQRRAWLDRYAHRRKISAVDRLQRSIERKVRRIARHDARLNARQPTRNVSIPG